MLKRNSRIFAVIVATTLSELASAQSADLAITKTGPDTIAIGSPGLFTVSFTNHGPDAAVNVVVADTTYTKGLPGHEVSITGVQQLFGPSFTCSGPPLTCVIGTLPAGASASFQYQIGVAPAQPVGSSVTNFVTIYSSTADPVIPNNSASVTATVAPASSLSTPAISLPMLVLLSLALVGSGLLRMRA